VTTARRAYGFSVKVSVPEALPLSVVRTFHCPGISLIGLTPTSITLKRNRGFFSTMSFAVAVTGRIS
jgi:hypothetical protein